MNQMSTETILFIVLIGFALLAFLTWYIYQKNQESESEGEGEDKNLIVLKRVKENYCNGYSKLTDTPEYKCSQEVIAARHLLYQAMRTVEDAKKEVLVLKDELVDAYSSISKLENELSIAIQSGKEKDKTIVFLNAEIAKLLNFIAKKDVEIETHITLIKNLESKVLGLNKVIQTQVNTISSLSSQLNSAKQQITSLTKQLTDSTVSDVENQKIIKNLTLEIDDLRKQIIALNGTITGRNTTITQLTNQLNVANNKVSSLSVELQGFSTQVETLTGAVGTCETSLVASKNELETCLGVGIPPPVESPLVFTEQKLRTYCVENFKKIDFTNNKTMNRTDKTLYNARLSHAESTPKFMSHSSAHLYKPTYNKPVHVQKKTGTWEEMMYQKNLHKYNPDLNTQPPICGQSSYLPQASACAPELDCKFKYDCIQHEQVDCSCDQDVNAPGGCNCFQKRDLKWYIGSM